MAIKNLSTLAVLRLKMYVFFLYFYIVKALHALLQVHATNCCCCCQSEYDIRDKAFDLSSFVVV